MTKTGEHIGILGAGIMGLSCAYQLSEAGHNVTVYDPKGFPAHNASWKAGGMLAPYSEIEHMSQDWVDAGLAGIQSWADFSKDHDIDFHQTGSLLIAHDEDTYILERFKTHLPQDKKNTTQTQDLEPLLQERFSSGLYLEEEAYLNPHQTLLALYEASKNHGVTFKEEAGDAGTLKDKLIIDCRGYNANEKTLRGVKGEIAIVHNSEFKLSRAVRLMHPRYPLYIVPRPDNHFMIGATMIESAEDNHVSVRSGLELMSALYSLHPSFAEAQVVELTSGIRPAYPDNLPRIQERENVISCNGLFRHGFLLAPVMAECVKHRISGEDHIYMSLFMGDSDEHHHQRRREELKGAA